jgi:hypothetical protein
MKRLLYGLAALPILSAVALADEPMPLTGAQMDQVSAGFFLRERDVSNTSVTVLGIYEPAPALCGSCVFTNGPYLAISSMAINLQSKFGP